ncbi:hypothetical protein FPZ54_10750 [Sphingomonas suaedae]|uniref:Tetratricopeptide repeat protein n=1 Tax=Sphingomonas suaedae TaxID=2599297 RepID=A0A518RGC6_9SPHN|nr:hypothetical protein FPZ54_10750 [Sphingomonas suaedae]
MRAYALTGIGIANLFEGDNDAAFAMLSEAAIHIAHYPVTIAALAVAAARRGDWGTARDALARLEEAGGTAADTLAIFQDPGLRAMILAELNGVQQRAAASAERR